MLQHSSFDGENFAENVPRFGEKKDRLTLIENAENRLKRTGLAIRVCKHRLVAGNKTTSMKRAVPHERITSAETRIREPHLRNVEILPVRSAEL